MKTQVSPVVVVLVILAVVAVVVLFGYRTVSRAGGGDAAVGVTKEGKPMTSEEGQAMMRKMRGMDKAPAAPESGTK